jgi:hypothetical protein
MGNKVKWARRKDEGKDADDLGKSSSYRKNTTL